MKLELKHLAPYLPYGLNYLSPKGVDDNFLINNGKPETIEKMGCIAMMALLDNDLFKPILRPLSDLKKEISIPEFGTFTPQDELVGYFGYDWHINFNDNLNILKSSVCVPFWNRLLEWHFDVFGLIEKGLAIDLNTLTKQQVS